MHQKLFNLIIFITVFTFFATTVNVSSVYAQVPGLSFDKESVSVTTNETFSVDVVVDTAGEEAGGVGAKIMYDTDYLQVMPVSGNSDGVMPGTLFSDYPRASFDNNSGEIVLSGIVSNINNLFSGRGILGSISFVALKPGSTTVVFDYTPGSTTDSNIAVTYGSGDVLEQVSDLNVDISAGTATALKSTPPSSSSGSTTSNESIFDRIIRFFKTTLGIYREPELDPYGTISNLPPNTSPVRTQPEVEVSGLRSGNVLFIGIVIVVTILIAIIVRLFLSRRRQSGPTVIQKDIEL